MAQLLLADPSIAGPKFHFGNQLVANNAPGVFANTAAAIPGADDDAWNLIQWSQQEVIDPAAVMLDAAATYDPALGLTAAYSWGTPDGETALRAYYAAAGGWVYDLTGAGTTTDPGEHDVFLSTAQSLAINMGGNEVDYAMNARVIAESSGPVQAGGGAVFAGAVTGFTFNYNLAGQPDYDPAAPGFTVFLQIPLSSTQNNSNLLSYFSATRNEAGQITSVISDQLRVGNALLPTTGSGATPEQYNLTAYVADLAAYLAMQPGAGTGVTDLARWTLAGVYTGVMTQGAGSRAEVQVSDVALTRADAPSTAAQQIDPPAPVTTVVVPPAATVSEGMPDPSGNAEDVARLFQAALGRHPTEAALAWYSAALNAGTVGLNDIAQGFLTAPEYLAQHGSETNMAFVTHVLEDATGSASGAAAWAAQLDAGASRGATLAGIATSPAAVLGNESWTGSNLYGQDYRAFEAVLGRAPDAAAQGWMAVMAGEGLTTQGIISVLAVSNEILTRYAAESPAQVVSGIYASGLGRAPDPQGLANAVTSLQTSGSVVSLAYSVSDSAEARSLYAGATHANWVALG